MLSREIMITNRLGLHARAAAKLVGVSGKFASTIMIEKDEQRINGKSIMGVMMLAASRGTALVLHVDGDDEEAAMQALVALIEDKFGEGE